MAKTSKQVEGDIYQLLKDSTLYTMISGEVYRRGMRPKDSQLEDAVVYFIAGIPAQIQTGVVSVLIFVPDIDPNDDGVFVEDTERTEQIERYAQEWVDSLTAEVSCYKFHLEQTIQTSEEADIHQHTVEVRLGYSYYGEDYAPLTVPQEAQLDVMDGGEDDGYYPLLEGQDGEEIVITPVVRKEKIIH